MRSRKASNRIDTRPSRRETTASLSLTHLDAVPATGSSPGTIRQSGQRDCPGHQHCSGRRPSVVGRVMGACSLSPPLACRSSQNTNARTQVASRATSSVSGRIVNTKVYSCSSFRLIHLGSIPTFLHRPGPPKKREGGKGRQSSGQYIGSFPRALYVPPPISHAHTQVCGLHEEIDAAQVSHSLEAVGARDPRQAPLRVLAENQKVVWLASLQPSSTF